MTCHRCRQECLGHGGQHVPGRMRGDCTGSLDLETIFLSDGVDILGLEIDSYLHFHRHLQKVANKDFQKMTLLPQIKLYRNLDALTTHCKPRHGVSFTHLDTELPLPLQPQYKGQQNFSLSAFIATHNSRGRGNRDNTTNKS